MGIIERILCKVFPYVDIKRADGALYLRRWFIYPRNKEFKKAEPRLYLHKFYRGDEDPHMHDHPWPFTSLILTRGYWEETEFKAFFERRIFDDHQWENSRIVDEPVTEEMRRQLFYPRFTILRRPAEWKHRVIIKDGQPVWTLVKTGVKERSWGFWVKGKLCPWRNYSNGVCRCDPDATATDAG